MSMHANVGDVIKTLRREFQDLREPQFSRAVSRALNRSSTAAKTLARKEIRAIYKINPERIKKHVDTDRKATPSSLLASIKAEDSMIPAIDFKRGRAKLSRGGGVYVNIKGERKLIKGAFVATMRSGHVGIFARADTARGYEDHEFQWRHVRLNKTGKDLPIAEVMTVGVPKAFSNSKIMQAMISKTRDKFPVVLRHELTRRLKMQREADSADEQE